MKIAILDTETTGLLKPEISSLNDQPYIIEIYATVLDFSKDPIEQVGELETLIRPPMAQLPEIITKITKIKDEDLTGKPRFAQIYPELAKLFTGVDIFVAHNAKFDKGMVRNELRRLDKVDSFPWPRHTICTVEASMGLAGHRLNLSRLHWMLFQKQFVDAHRAKNDVFALVRCFNAMVEKNIINLDNYK